MLGVGWLSNVHFPYGPFGTRACSKMEASALNRAGKEKGDSYKQDKNRRRGAETGNITDQLQNMKHLKKWDALQL